MAVKMTRNGLADLDAWLDGRGGDELAVMELVEFVNRRWDCADFRLVSLLKLLLAAPRDSGSEATWDAVTDAVLGFRYWMDEPGEDSMVFWSENHQVLFFTCAYLAGSLFPDRRFTNSGRPGRVLRDEAHTRLLRWLAARFRFGYSEWTSTTYYEEDAAALAMLVTHADDDDIVAGARTALDLLFLDMALHHFDGRMVASSGRAYEAQSKAPETAEVNQLIRWAFGDREAPFNLERLAGLVTVSSYRVPEAIRAIAADQSRVTIRTSAGLDLHEVADLTGGDHDVEGTVLQFWLQEAFTTPESMDVTMGAIRTWDLDSNAFLRPLQTFAPLARTRLLPTLVRLVNPATRGVAIQRADVVTHRSPHVQLSSAQRHHPGGFGDQQLIWMAGLKGNINVFGTHPASPLFDGPERNFSPSAWVGNGIMPDVAQHDGVLLAVYDTTPRRGYLERDRQRRSHVYFPAHRFDEVSGDDHLVAGRAGDGFIALLGSDVLEEESPDAIQQRGPVTCWGVITSGADQMGWEEFLRFARDSSIERDDGVTRLTTPLHTYSLTRRGPFLVDGATVDGVHPRFESPWVEAPRFPRAISVEAGGHTLVLHPPGGAGR